MKVKSWVAYINNSKEYYFIDAPSKRIAKWCGAALYNNEYPAAKSSRDVQVERYKLSKEY